MMKLGFICEPMNNAMYRVVVPLRALEKRGHTVVWPAQLGEDVPMRELLRCDLVHCYRRLGRIDDFRRLSERGVAISFDNDDNYAAADVSEVGLGLEGHLYNKKLFRKILEAAKLADLTTTPNPILADIYRSAGARKVAVIENHLSRGMFGFGSQSKRDGVVVGWVAGHEHALDLKRIPVAAALRRLLAAHPNLRVLTVGLRLPLDSDRYEHILEVEFRDLLKISGRIDIGMAPLADTPFNCSRSSAKLKEYSSGGAAWLASPVGPYRELGPAQGGLLVGDEEWFTALDKLIRSSRERKRLARRALKWAKAQTIEHFASVWEESFTSAIEGARERMGQAPVRVSTCSSSGFDA